MQNQLQHVFLSSNTCTPFGPRTRRGETACVNVRVSDEESRFCSS